MKEQLIENYGAAVLEAAVTTAIPPPVREPGRAPERRPRKLAPSVTRAYRLRKAMAKVEVYRAMLHARSMAPLGLSHELVLVLTNRDCVGDLPEQPETEAPPHIRRRVSALWRS